MKIPTWNVERLRHKGELDMIQDCCKEAESDILFLAGSDAQIKMWQTLKNSRYKAMRGITCMKNVNFPLDGLPSTEELNNLLQSMIESSGNFVNYMMKIQDDKKLMLDFNGISLDTYGCEHLFVDFFINDEMRKDFPLIARDFYVHEFANIPKHQDVEYFDIESGEDWPELMFNRFTLGLMMNAVNNGSEYTKALFLYLHKIYYKKEYRTLKRFSKMSLSELLALAKPEGRRHLYYANLSRILCIAPMYDIKFDVECNVVYGILNEFINKFGLSVGYSFDEAVGDSFKDCRKEIDERFDQKKLYSLDAKMSKFLGNVFQWLGYSPEYADWCDEDDRGVEDRLAIVLSILKKTFPKSNKEYSAEELTLYGMIFHCASAMTCNSSWLAEMLRTLAYGESGTFYYDEFPSMFHPEASGSTDVSIVDKADYVYFFTDIISHSKYHQFMNVIRERKINFGYIHGVNIEKNIRDIYVDFEED